MLVGQLRPIQAVRRLEFAVLDEIQRVTPRELEDGARAVGFGSERYREKLDQAELSRLKGKDRAAAAAAVAHRRRKRTQDPESRREPELFIPVGWLIADHCVLSHQQPSGGEGFDDRDRVELSGSKACALAFSLEDPALGWLLAPGTLGL